MRNKEQNRKYYLEHKDTNRAKYAANSKKYYLEHKETTNAHNRARWNEIRNLRIDKKRKAVEYMGGKCSICNIVDTCMAIYDFHHKDPSSKNIEIDLIITGSWNKLIKELDKCILVCSNCHRKLHFERGL